MKFNKISNNKTTLILSGFYENDLENVNEVLVIMDLYFLIIRAEIIGLHLGITTSRFHT